MSPSAATSAWSPGPDTPSPAAVLWRLSGRVQGVGFRPTAYRLATALALRGWVRNDPAGAELLLVGPPAAIRGFQTRLPSLLPPAAAIDAASAVPLPSDSPLLAPPPADFAIRESPLPLPGAPLPVSLLPDLATCPECLRELFDPADRRHRYPFLNCTHCGPRASIVAALPYDRPRTSMAAFPLCPDCAAEYADPANRRFHAQPVACPVCGPRLEWRAAPAAPPLYREEALQAAQAALRAGKILALKGISGYHLLVDARDPAAVARLRARKRRDAKPFAVMYPSLPAVRDAFPGLRPAEAAALASPAAPIVLLPFAEAAPALAAGRALATSAIAPGLSSLGVLLPYSPLHHLLLRDLGFPLVATSANFSGEPLCYLDDDALARLAPVADAFLLHNRPIVRPADDSVLFLHGDAPVYLRRARGLAPFTLLPAHRPPPPDGIIGAGAHLKNTVAVTLSHRLVVSPHVGDLDHPASLDRWRKTIEDLTTLHGVTPQSVAADAHPDLPSVRAAGDFASARALPFAALPHHHAHLRAVLLEHPELPPPPPLLGVAFDGAGASPTLDAVWGGEFFLAAPSDPAPTARRVASIRPFPLPGGDAASRRPALVAAAMCHLADLPIPDALPLAPAERANLPPLLRSPLSPPCTSVGRLFDAASSLLGLVHRNDYEGHAALLLQSAATRHAPTPADRDSPLLPLAFTPGGDLDWAPWLPPLLQAAPADVPRLAWHFHLVLARAIVAVARRHPVAAVALSGGCFQNPLLLAMSCDLLSAASLTPVLPRQLPPNDAALSAAQASP